MNKDEILLLRAELQLLLTWHIRKRMAPTDILQFIEEYGREFHDLFSRHPHMFCRAYEYDKVRMSIMMSEWLQLTHERNAQAFHV